MHNTSFDSTKTRLEDILKDIQEGRIQLPDFQRDWVWDDERVVDILTSVALSFPIGSIMLLETGDDSIRFMPRPFSNVVIPQMPVPKSLYWTVSSVLRHCIRRSLLNTPYRPVIQSGKLLNDATISI